MSQRIEFDRTIYYLGNKAKSAKNIDQICANAFGESSSVLDLFAGSGSNARQFGTKRRVIANDIQMYSYIICSAILSKTPYSESDIFALLNSYSANEKIDNIKDCYSNLISFENKLIETPGHQYIKNHILDLKFDTSGTRLDNSNQDHVIVDHFGGLYFSYEQACELQGLLEISNELAGGLREQFLATILSTASRISNTVGNQFAQPLKLTDRHGAIKEGSVRKFRKERSRSAIQLFRKCIKIYSNINNRSDQNVCTQSIDNEAMKKYLGDVDFVYADPPYGREHYSRYYHVLETIARNDKPNVSSDSTMIRIDRHQSDYCIKSKVENAFENMFSTAGKSNTPIALSYADQASGTKERNRVLPLKKIQEIAARYYDSVKMHDVSTRNYSQMNNSSFASEHRRSREILLIAK